LLSPMFENMKQLLYAKGKPGAIVRVRVVQLVIFLPAMYLLVVSMGISGAALAVVVNYAVGVIGAMLVVRREVRVQWLQAFALPLLFGAAAAAIVLAFPLPDPGLGAMARFGLEALYLIGIFIVLELVTERRRLKEHLQYIRGVMNGASS